MRWRPRIGLMMLSVALLPLLGLVVVSVERVSDVSAHREDVAIVRDTLEELTALMEVSGHLSDEKHWLYATTALEELGVSREVVIGLVQLDPWSELSTTADELDAVLDQLGDAQLIERVATLRSEVARAVSAIDAPEADELEAINFLYTGFEEELDERRHRTSERLFDLPNTAELAGPARVLDLVGEMRDDATSQLSAFFSLQFRSSEGPQEAMRQLIASDSRYADNLVELHSQMVPASTVHDTLDDVLAAPEVRFFDAQVDQAVRRTLEEGAATSDGYDFATALDNADQLAETFLSASASSTMHASLVHAAVDDITDLAAAMDERAARDAQLAVAFSVAITLGSVAIAVIGGRAIVSPLRRMSAVADSMRLGSLDERVEESGPREIRSAARALNEAVDQLQLSERQALALARGDLEDPVLDTPVPGALGRSLREAVTHLATSLSDREEYRRRLAHEAAHDGLTGLPNRTAVLSHLDRALGRAHRTGDQLAVLFVDLDGFRQLNELHGHSAGDRILVQVAQRLRSTIRQSDVVGRLGADEFLVVAEPVGEESEAAVLAERLLEAVNADLVLGGTTLSIGASAGIATSSGNESPDELIREADVAVAEAKRRGRNQIRFCDDELRARITSRTVVERGLATAIEEDHLVLHFQRLVDARTEEPVSLEALVRWIHPENGMIPPNEFIPIAEASDLIVQLDRWVLGKAAAQLAEWSDHPELSSLTLAVNLSERHLGHPRLIEHIMEPLRTHGVDPRRLVLEVTETALLDDLATAATQLAVLRSFGVQVAIDDFGTGYTSLAHLRALPVDVLKVDQSFVANLDRDDERSLVELIIQIGHQFGLEVVAEGVETAGAARELLRLGVDTLQGFHFSRPVPADVLDAEMTAGDQLPAQVTS